MPTITIRNLSDATYRAIEARAAQHDRSTDAEIRYILESAARPDGRLRIGSAIAEISRRHGVTYQDIEALDLARGYEAGRKPIDVAQLRLLTASTPSQTQTAADLVQSMRDEDRS